MAARRRSADEVMAAASKEFHTAKRFAQMGWLVGFMPYGAKHGGDFGIKSFTDSAEALLVWRSKMGARCNIALMPPAGCVILDVDLYKLNGLEYELAEAKVRKFIKATNCSAATSANGGIHLLVRDREDLNNANVRALFDCPGEVRRRGKGYVIGPGSTFNGKPYKEIEGHEFDGRPVPDLPLGVTRPVVVPAVGNTAAQDFEPVKEVRNVIPLRELRNALGRVPADEYDIWLRVGMALKYDYEDAGFTYWDWWSQKSSKYPGAEELRRKWDTFGKNKEIQPVTTDTIHYIARQHGYGRASAQQDFGNGWMQKYAVRASLENDPPAHDWILQGILLKGKVAMLAGAGGSGKSMLMYRIAAHYALGIPNVLGRPDLTLFDPPLHPGKVLLLSAEDDADDVHRRVYAYAEHMMVLADEELKDRLGSRFAAFPVGGKDCRLVDNNGKPTDFADRIIEECLADGEVGLIMMDPSVFFSGIEDNSAERVALYMRVLTGIAKRTGAGVLVVTHTRKGTAAEAELSSDNVRGSSAYVDLARSAIVMRGMTKEEAPLWSVGDTERWRYVGVTVVKNNYAPQNGDPIWMQRGPGGVLHAPTPPIAKMSAAQVAKRKEQLKVEKRVAREEIAKTLKAERTQLMVLADVGKHKGGTVQDRAARLGLSLRTVQNALAVMLNELKWIAIDKPAHGHTPHTYKLTLSGKTREMPIKE